MNRIAIRHALVLLIATLFPSPVTTTSTQHFGDRETDFLIRLSSVISPRGINASIITTNLYPCAGYRLRSYTTYEMDTITIHINGMVRPAPCVQGTEAAAGNAFLSDLADGVYYLRVRYRGETDLHQLSVTRGHAKVKSPGARFTKIRGF